MRTHPLARAHAPTYFSPSLGLVLFHRYYSYVYIYSSTFEANDASSYGGGIYASYGSIYSDASHFASNSARYGADAMGSRVSCSSTSACPADTGDVADDGCTSASTWSCTLYSCSCLYPSAQPTAQPTDSFAPTTNAPSPLPTSEPTSSIARIDSPDEGAVLVVDQVGGRRGGRGRGRTLVVCTSK